MYPYLNSNDIVIINYKFKLIIGKIYLILLDNNHFIIKRLCEINGNCIWVEGDNKKDSIDSRHYGYIYKKQVLGILLCKITFLNRIL